jgi:hypothetical protein
MSTITRTWITFAALGTGIIHIALVVGAPLPLGIALGALGIAEVVWALFAMAGSRLPAARLALLVAMAPIVVWAVAMFAAVSLDAPAAGSALPLLPLAVAALLEIAAAAAIAVSLRRTAREKNASPAGSGIDGGEQVPAPHAGRYLAALLITGMAVASLVTPALAATEAGGAAVPHGEHPGGFLVDTEHGGHQGRAR